MKDDSIDLNMLLSIVDSAKIVALNFQIQKNIPIPEDSLKQNIILLINIYFPDLEENQKDEIFNYVKHQVDISVEEAEKEGTCIVEKDQSHIEWLDDTIKDTTISWDHWNYYKKLILTDKTAASKERFLKLDKETNGILKLIESPRRDGAWDCRGLVVGDVQAGKTSNYTGLIAKAIDVGYKVIIILAGSTNDLRIQTQERIDEGILGYSSDKSGNNGIIATPPMQGKTVQTHTNQSQKGDYSKNYTAKNFRGDDCHLYVVKKNGSILRNLLMDFLNQQEIEQTNIIKDVPLLLIDDEADYASPNTKTNTLIDPLTKEIFDEADIDPTCINRYIRAILSCFEKSVYIGYTATPYANIFELPNHGKETTYDDHKINKTIKIGEDLFPRNFIYKLDTPKNYIGIEKVFGTESSEDDALPVVIKVDEEFHNDFAFIKQKTGKLKQVIKDNPKSLKHAINVFIISSIIKKLRNAKPIHNTMLVHIDRLVSKQEDTKNWVASYLSSIKELFTIEPKEKQDLYLLELEQIWKDEFKSKYKEIHDKISEEVADFEWIDIEKLIPEFISDLCCKTVNGKTLDALDYKNHPKGLNVIAIGGDKLARGLTLEGLTISYFIRNAGAYDTLTQMGRWFGYRDKYVDVCRLYLTSSTYNNFREISFAIHDLNNQFFDLSENKKTPKDFGLRVIINPQSKLLVTARNKSKNAIKHTVSFSASPIPTAYLPNDYTINQKNMQVIKDFIQELGHETGRASSVRNERSEEKNVYWKDVSSSLIIKYFLQSNFFIDKQNSWFTLSDIAEFVIKGNQNNEIKNWTVVLVNGEETEYSLPLNNDIKIVPSKRKIEPYTDGQTYYELWRRRIPTGTNECFDLSQEQYDKALSQTNEKRKRVGKDRTNVPSPHYIRFNRDKNNALLLLYALRLHDENNIFIDQIIPGFMISFPELMKSNKDQTFWANAIYEKNGKASERIETEGLITND